MLLTHLKIRMRITKSQHDMIKNRLSLSFSIDGKKYYNKNVGFLHFLDFGSMVKMKKGMKIRHLIWLTTIWSIWRMRNNIIFKGGT
jgi:hypothetical protein